MYLTRQITDKQKQGQLKESNGRNHKKTQDKMYKYDTSE